MSPFVKCVENKKIQIFQKSDLGIGRFIMKVLPILLFAPIVCFADMHLTCDLADPAMDITEVRVTMDGNVGEWTPYVEAVFDGETRCDLMNVTGLVNGNHEVTAEWRNSWGEASAPSSPLSFSRPAIPTTGPAGLGLKRN